MPTFRSRLFQATMIAEMIAEFNPNRTRDIVDWFGDEISDEALAVLKLRGRVLGSEGTMRTAYAHRTDPSLCIKVAATRNYSRGHTEGNELEADAWSDLKGTPVAKWFAPVRWISECNFVLLQDRAQVYKNGVPLARLPKQLPGIFAWLPDMHDENFGFIKGQIVALDYPFHNMKKAVRSDEALVMRSVSWQKGSPPKFID